MSGTQTDGQDLGQTTDVVETGAGGDTTGGDSKPDRLADMEARFEMLQDSIVEMRNALLSSRQSAQTAPEKDIDDDEPLTPSKVKKIVRDGVAAGAAVTTNLTQRQQWDDKAKSEFPLADPKFLLEFKREWKEQVAGGLDPNHPRAVYNVAKITARTSGVVKRPAKDPETAQTSEAPSGASRQNRQQTSRTSPISDNDPRLAFYLMKGGKSKEKIEAVKAKLAERDAKQARRAK